MGGNGNYYIIMEGNEKVFYATVGIGWEWEYGHGNGRE